MSLQGAFEHFRLVSSSACFGAGIVAFFSADLQKKSSIFLFIHRDFERNFLWPHCQLLILSFSPLDQNVL